MACGPVGGSNVGELTVESNGKTIYIVGKRVMMKTDKRLLHRRFLAMQQPFLCRRQK